MAPARPPRAAHLAACSGTSAPPFPILSTAQAARSAAIFLRREAHVEGAGAAAGGDAVAPEDRRDGLRDGGLVAVKGEDILGGGEQAVEGKDCRCLTRATASRVE